jgi:hypothetical protein
MGEMLREMGMQKFLILLAEALRVEMVVRPVAVF